MKILSKQPTRLLSQTIMLSILSFGLLITTVPSLRAAPQDNAIDQVLGKLQNNPNYKEFSSVLLGQTLPDSPEGINALNDLWQNLPEQDQETIAWINPGISDVLAGDVVNTQVGSQVQSQGQSSASAQEGETSEIMVTTAFSTPSAPSTQEQPTQSFNSGSDPNPNIQYDGGYVNKPQSLDQEVIKQGPSPKPAPANKTNLNQAEANNALRELYGKLRDLSGLDKALGAYNDDGAPKVTNNILGLRKAEKEHVKSHDINLFEARNEKLQEVKGYIKKIGVLVESGAKVPAIVKKAISDQRATAEAKKASKSYEGSSLQEKDMLINIEVEAKAGLDETIIELQNDATSKAEKRDNTHLNDTSSTSNQTQTKTGTASIQDPKPHNNNINNVVGSYGEHMPIGIGGLGIMYGVGAGYSPFMMPGVQPMDQYITQEGYSGGDNIPPVTEAPEPTPGESGYGEQAPEYTHAEIEVMGAAASVAAGGVDPSFYQGSVNDGNYGGVGAMVGGLGAVVGVGIGGPGGVGIDVDGNLGTDVDMMGGGNYDRDSSSAEPVSSSAGIGIGIGGNLGAGVDMIGGGYDHASSSVEPVVSASGTSEPGAIGGIGGGVGAALGIAVDAGGGDYGQDSSSDPGAIGNGGDYSGAVAASAAGGGQDNASSSAESAAPSVSVSAPSADQGSGDTGGGGTPPSVGAAAAGLAVGSAVTAP